MKEHRMTIAEEGLTKCLEDPLLDGYDELADDATEIRWRGGGVMLGLMGAKQAQKMALYLLGKAKECVILTCYTFDYAPLVAALKETKARGVDVKVIADKGHMMAGATVTMPERLEELRAAGVEVGLCKGPGGKSGIQHSKTLLCDKHAIIGSCNWTNSSRQNNELCALIALNEEGLLAWERRMTMLRRDCVEMDADHVETAREVRSARSASRGRRTKGGDKQEGTAADMYRTAKRFSVARQLALSKQTGEDSDPPWSKKAFSENSANRMALAGSSNRARSARRAVELRISPRDRAASSHSRFLSHE